VLCIAAILFSAASATFKELPQELVLRHRKD